MTRNSAERLPRLVSQLYRIADEVIIGVDASSTDKTWSVARRWGDRIYRFSLSGHTAPARELVFQFASGDWILSIDDDELVEDNFGDVIRELVQRPGLTHAWFPRKWIVGDDPSTFAHEQLWYPDWQLRLFRNERVLAYKPSAVHTGYRVSGPGIRETRTHILHLEPLILNAEGRHQKLSRYQTLGSSKLSDSQFRIPPGTATRPVVMPHISVRPPAGRGELFTATRRLPAASQLRWRSEVIRIDAASKAEAGKLMLATIHVKNTGELAWMPHSGGHVALSLGSHLRDAQGNMLQYDRDRLPVFDQVMPGGIAVFHCTILAPGSPGEFIFEWDMVSEGECWFADLGGKPLRHTLIVEPAAASNAASRS